MTKALHLCLHWAVSSTSYQVWFASSKSLSMVLRLVSCGLPRLLLSPGFQSRVCLGILQLNILRTGPSQVKNKIKIGKSPHRLKSLDTCTCYLILRNYNTQECNDRTREDRQSCPITSFCEILPLIAVNIKEIVLFSGVHSVLQGGGGAKPFGD